MKIYYASGVQLSDEEVKEWNAKKFPIHRRGVDENGEMTYYALSESERELDSAPSKVDNLVTDVLGK